MLAGRSGWPVVGRDRQQPIIELLANETANGRAQPGLVSDGIDEGHQPVGLLDDPGSIVLAVGVVHPDGAIICEPIDAIGEVGRQSPLNLVWLDIQIRARSPLTIVRDAGNECADERRFAMIDVTGRPDDDVIGIGVKARPLIEHSDANNAVLDSPRFDILDMDIGVISKH